VKIHQSEYEQRTKRLAEHARERGLSGIVLFDPAYVLYYVGFAFVPTERPMAFVLNADGQGGLLVPRLEREHAQANALVGEVAEHLLEGGAIRILETEGAGDLAGADVAGFLADEGKHVLFGGEGGVSAGLEIQIYVQEYFTCSPDGAKRNPGGAEPRQKSGLKRRASGSILTPVS